MKRYRTRIGGSVTPYWTQQKINDSCLFFASDPTSILNKVVATQLPNQVTGAVDFLTVTGSGLNARYRTPDSDTYRTADSDNVFWKSDASESTCDGNRLIAYDFPRILVKYMNVAPYTILWIAILKPGVTVTNGMRDAFDLNIWWSNTLSFHGNTKQNKPLAQQYVWVSESVYEAEYTAILAKVTGTAPSSTVKTKHNNFIKYLKGDNSDSRNTWAKLCCLIPYQAGMPDAADALLWWNNPDRKAVLSATPPVYTVGAGFMGGTNKYIDTDWNPTEDADGKYERDSGSVGFLFNNHRVNGTGGGTSGLIDAGSNGIICVPISSDGNTYMAMQSAYQVPVPWTQVDYFIIMKRTGANAYSIFKNKNIALDSTTVASTPLLNGNVYCLAYNALGTGAVNFASDSIGLFFAGDELDQIDVNVLNDAVALLA